MPPAVSVVIPAYNRQRLLSRAIESVLAQTFRDFEIIVVDDASQEEIGAVTASIASDCIRYVRQERNQGAAAARNRAMELAEGELIAFLDSDDYWRPEKLEIQVAALRRDGNARVAVCGSEIHFAEGRPAVRRIHRFDGDCRPALIASFTGSVTSGLIIHRSLLDNGLRWDESLPAFQDWDFLVQASALSPLVNVREPLFVLHRSANANDHVWNPVNERLGLRIIMRKYNREFRADSLAMARRLLYLGTLEARGGNHTAARSLMFKAWLTRPSSLRYFAWFCASLMGPTISMRVIERHMAARAS